MFVYAGAAALLERDKLPAAGEPSPSSAWRASVDHAFDRDAGGVQLVFAGGEAEPLYIV